MLRTLALALFLTLFAAADAGADERYGRGLGAYDQGRYGEAAQLWGELAEEGHAFGQLALAGLYRAGQGVPHDLEEAARWYRAAAEQGLADGQRNLAELYVRGAGVERDPVEAYAWFALAAAQGRDFAERRRDEIAADLSEAELERAKARAQVLAAELARE